MPSDQLAGMLKLTAPSESIEASACVVRPKPTSPLAAPRDVKLVAPLAQVVGVTPVPTLKVAISPVTWAAAQDLAAAITAALAALTLALFTWAK
jgi:hypothetical protein